MTQTGLLASKPRFEILDGLRGVAAMIVVAFHLFEAYSKGPVYQILNHGYLAVDFFFVLSGFVIGYAYDDRWSKMTFKDFIKRRLIRLHPLVILGTFIGALLFYFSASPFYPLVEETPWWKMLLLLLLGCTMLPALASWDIRGQEETNALNGPTWSLMYEYIANILYALFIRRFSKTVLVFFVAVSAFFTLDLTLNLDVFGLLASRDYAKYTVIGGWSITPSQMYIGFTRLLYPFFMGLLVFRMNKLIKIKAGFWWCSLLTAIILVMPRIGGEEHGWMNGVYEAFCILVMFPVIVAIGAGSMITGKQSADLCQFLGDISYPIYITHYTLVYMQTAWVSNHPDAPLGTNICLSVATFIFSIGVAHACLKLFDIPVRNWLQKRYLVVARKAKVEASLETSRDDCSMHETLKVNNA